MAGRPFLLGCPGGRSPKPIYQALARQVSERDLSLAHVTIVMMDEYLVCKNGDFDYVDAESHYSCRRFARDQIAAILNGDLAPEGGTAPDRTASPDPKFHSDYHGGMENVGGTNFFILAGGASTDHAAFNPQGSARASRTRILLLAEATRQDNMKTFPQFASVD